MGNRWKFRKPHLNHAVFCTLVAFLPSERTKTHSNSELILSGELTGLDFETFGEHFRGGDLRLGLHEIRNKVLPFISIPAFALFR
jgi:hypothetical protein